MDLNLFIKKTLAGTCKYFTVITVLYTIIVAVIHPKEDELLLGGVFIFSFFAFSFLFALANSILKIESLPSVVRRLAHFFIVAGAFLFCVLFPNLDSNLGGSFIIIGMSAFTLVYVICAAVIAIVKSSVSRKRNKNEEYQNRFSK